MTKIDMSPVKGSSAIESQGYDPESRTLRVRFKGGKTYDHPDVPLEKYAAFTGADSTGNFYNKKIRDAHPAQKLKD